MSDKIDTLIKIVKAVSDNQTVIIEEIKGLSQRISDLEITVLSYDFLEEANPIKLRLAGKRK